MLYVCATPIGNLEDASPRLRETLARVALVAAEDTRRTRKLLSHFGIHTPLTSFYQHNEAQKTEEVLARLRRGEDVALVTDAGMPGIQDPGMRLVARAAAEGLPLTVVPGPSAVVAALVAAGIPGDGFRFVGYLPRRTRDLEAALARWRRCGGLMVAFETGQRLPRSLAALAAALPQARAAVCRELTKVHEEVVRGTLAELSARYPVPERDLGRAAAVRGEVTLVVDLGPPAEGEGPEPGRLRRAAEALLARGLSRRDAAQALHVCLGVARREADAVVRDVTG